MTALRIAIVAPPWVPVPPPAYGGTEAVIDQLVRGLTAAGHDARLIATGDSTCPVTTSWVYDHAEGDAMGNAAIELRHTIHAYDQLDGVDIVHDHTLTGPVVAAGITNGPPVVTTNHGPFNPELSALYRFVSRRVPIVAISRRQASTAGDIPIAAVIHHGVDPAEHPVGNGTDGYVLFLGRMAPTKGVDIAARAARAAGVPLVIAAKMREAPEREYFEAAVRPLLGRGVEYVGEVRRHEKLQLLGGAAALVNPLMWDEPFGMVMVEALACGTPVLAFPNGATPEIVDHGSTGFLCTGERDLSGKLARVGELSRHACRRSAVLRFSTSRMVSQHVDLYRRVIHADTSAAIGRSELAAIA